MTAAGAAAAAERRPRWRFRLMWEPRDLWVGAYIGPPAPLGADRRPAGPNRAIYVCLLPTVVLRIRKEHPAVWWTMHHDPEPDRSEPGT